MKNLKVKHYGVVVLATFVIMIGLVSAGIVNLPGSDALQSSEAEQAAGSDCSVCTLRHQKLKHRSQD